MIMLSSSCYYLLNSSANEVWRIGNNESLPLSIVYPILLDFDVVTAGYFRFIRKGLLSSAYACIYASKLKNETLLLIINNGRHAIRYLNSSVYLHDKSSYYRTLIDGPLLTQAFLSQNCNLISIKQFQSTSSSSISVTISLLLNERVLEIKSDTVASRLVCLIHLLDCSDNAHSWLQFDVCDTIDWMNSSSDTTTNSCKESSMHQMTKTSVSAEGIASTVSFQLQKVDLQMHHTVAGLSFIGSAESSYVCASASGQLSLYRGNNLIASSYISSSNMKAFKITMYKDLYAIVHIEEEHTMQIFEVSDDFPLLVEINGVSMHHVGRFAHPLYDQLLVIPTARVSTDTDTITADLADGGIIKSDDWCIFHLSSFVMSQHNTKALLSSLWKSKHISHVSPRQVDISTANQTDGNDKKKKKKKKKQQQQAHDSMGAVDNNKEAVVTAAPKTKSVSIERADTKKKECALGALEVRLLQITDKLGSLGYLLNTKNAMLTALRNRILPNDPVSCFNRYRSTISLSDAATNNLSPLFTAAASASDTATLDRNAATGRARYKYAPELIDATYIPAPSTWSTTVCVRVKNTSPFALFHIHVQLQIVNPAIASDTNSVGVHEIRCNTHTSTNSGKVMLLMPGEEAWVFAVVNLPQNIFTSTISVCPMSIALSWVELSGADIVSVSHSEEKLLQLILSDATRACFEVGLGWLPSVSRTAVCGYLILTVSDMLKGKRLGIDSAIASHKLKRFMHMKHAGLVAPFLLANSYDLPIDLATATATATTAATAVDSSDSDSMFHRLKQWYDNACSEGRSIVVRTYVPSIDCVVESTRHSHSNAHINQCDFGVLNHMIIDRSAVADAKTDATNRDLAMLRALSNVHTQHTSLEHYLLTRNSTAVDSVSNDSDGDGDGGGDDDRHTTQYITPAKLVTNNAVRGATGALLLGSAFGYLKHYLSIQRDEYPGNATVAIRLNRQHAYNMMRLAVVYLLEEMKTLSVAHREQILRERMIYSPHPKQPFVRLGADLEASIAVATMLLQRQKRTDVYMGVCLSYCKNN